MTQPTRPLHHASEPLEDIVLGVDTHKDIHVAALITTTGGLLDTRSFPTTEDGYRQLLAWASAFGRVQRAGVECTGSYGAALTRYLHHEGITVTEVNQPDKATRRRRGKTDAIDAADQAVLSGRATATAKTSNGPVEAIRMFKMAKVSATKSRSQAINQLKAVLVAADPAPREALSGLSNAKLIRKCSELEAAENTAPAAAARHTLRLLARRIQHLTEEINDLTTRRITRAIAVCAPRLLDRDSVGPDTAAALLITAGDNPDRMGSEASFAALCGVRPVEASSGKTQRRRLNRGGDRQATPRSTPSSWPASAEMPVPATTWSAVLPRARPGVKPSAASKATSHERSTRRSTRPSALRRQRIDIHRGIKLAVRYEATVQLTLIRQGL